MSCRSSQVYRMRMIRTRVTRFVALVGNKANSERSHNPELLFYVLSYLFIYLFFFARAIYVVVFLCGFISHLTRLVNDEFP